jgi:fluoride exporter
MRLLILTGFLGGYTTFSTFENDTLTLWERGEGMLAAANVIGSVVIGLAAVILGTALGRGLTK